MTEERIRYRRLSGLGWPAPRSWVRPWLGPDHLLLVGSRIVSEVYRRLYFRDIQAIIIRRTAEGHVWTALLTLLLGLFGLLTLRALQEGPLPLYLPLCLLASGGALVRHLWLEPTCQCHVRTAVNVQRLHFIRRVRTAKRFVAALRPLLAQAQGQMPVEEVRRRAVELAAQGPPPFRPGAGLASAQPGSRRPYDGIAHVWLLAALSGMCVLHVMCTFHRHVMLDVLLLLMVIGVLAAAITAAVRQGGARFPEGLRALPWLSIGYIFLVWVFSSMGNAFEPPQVRAARGDVAGPTETILIHAAGAVGTGLLAVVGSLQLAAFRRRFKQVRATEPRAPSEGA